MLIVAKMDHEDLFNLDFKGEKDFSEESLLLSASVDSSRALNHTCTKVQRGPLTHGRAIFYRVDFI